MRPGELEQKLADIYGEDQAKQVARTILPGILADFHKLLQAAKMGERVEETYRMEDGRASIFLSCRKQRGVPDMELSVRKTTGG